MAIKAAKIDDSLFQALRSLWATEDFPFSAITYRLREQFGITHQTGWERLLLYGRTGDDEMVEQIVGWLIAITPGIIILDTHSDDLLRPLSGIVERHTRFDSSLFRVRTFSVQHGLNPCL